MKLPKLAIENASFTAVVLVLLTLLGAVSFWTMPRSEDPQFNTPAVTISAVYPGASPADMESLVVDPIEDELGELEDVDRIESTIQDGVSTTSIEFLASVESDDALEDVQQAVAGVRADLPDELQRLAVDAFTTTDVTVYQTALVSETASYEPLQRTAERLERRLERVGGVKQAETWAYPDQEVRVALDLERLRETGLALDRVIGAIQADAQNVPGGDLDVGNRQFNVQTTGDYDSLDEIRRTVVGQNGSSLVHLRDVARVEHTTADVTHRARFEGERAVFVTVTQRGGVNIFTVLDNVKAELEAFRGELPGSVTMHEVFDQSESVASRVNGFFWNLLQGILLVGGVVLLALGGRASGIVMTAIPLSILIAIYVLDVTGFGLQQISIVGLVIALGLLVDDAIVITENVARFRRKGHSAIEAAIKGTDEVGWAVASTSVTSVLAFLPIVLVQSGSGDFIRSMPLTVIYALGASLVVTLTLTPLLAAKTLGAEKTDKGTSSDVSSTDDRSRDDPHHGHDLRPPVVPTSTSETDEKEGFDTWFGRVLERAVEGPYRRALDWALGRRGIVVGLAVLALAGSASLFPIIGVSFFPNAEKPQFLVSVTTPEGSSLATTDRAVRNVERWLDGRDDVQRYAANVGRDNPIVYYNVTPRREKSTVGQVYVEAKRAEDVPQIAADLEAAMADVPGARYETEIFKNGPPVEAPVAIKVIGPELDELRRLAGEVETMMRRTDGTMNVDNPLSETKTDLAVNVDRGRAGMLGVPLSTVDRTVRMAVAGLPVSTYRDAEGEEQDIVIGLGRDTQVSDLERLAVASANGAQVPLRQIADVEFAREPTRIDHFDTERAVTITADVEPGASSVAVTQAVVKKLDATTLPTGYRTFVGGELEAQEDSFASLLPALLGAVFGILAVLVLQFNSLRQPFIILTAIPLSVIGAFPALLLTGYTFSFTAFVGFTSLAGIVVNNATILVDYANQLMDRGHSVVEAVTVAGETRFAPILLTTLTTIGGLLPLTLSGSSLWSPLGWVIIGGLLVSTVLTLVVVPVLYTLLTSPPTANQTAA
jgi:multidrug efflux pump subunit AcrB